MKHGDPVTQNRDFLARGIANLLSGLFHGMPVGAGYSATSANEAAGARSRLVKQGTRWPMDGPARHQLLAWFIECIPPPPCFCRPLCRP